MKIVFDENMPHVGARAVGMVAEELARADGRHLDVCHALDVVAAGTADVTLIEAITTGENGRVVLVTTDKSMRTRRHERAAFEATGCIGIVLCQHWNHASMLDRVRHSLLWWETWIATVEASPKGTLWRCPWRARPAPLRFF